MYIVLRLFFLIGGEGKSDSWLSLSLSELVDPFPVLFFLYSARRRIFEPSVLPNFI